MPANQRKSRSATAIKNIDTNCFSLGKFKTGKFQKYATVEYNNPKNNVVHAMNFVINYFSMKTKGIPYLDSDNPHGSTGYYGHDGKRTFARISLDETQPALAEARALFIALDEWAESEDVIKVLKQELGADDLCYSPIVQNFSSNAEDQSPDMAKIKFDVTFKDADDTNPALKTVFYKDGEKTPYRPASITELEQVFTWNSEVRTIVNISIMWCKEKIGKKKVDGKSVKSKTVEYGINLVFKKVEFTTGGKDDAAGLGFGDEESEEEETTVKPTTLDSDEEEESESEEPVKKKPSKKKPEPESDEEEEPVKKKPSKKKPEPEPESDEEEFEEESEEEVVIPKKHSKK